MLLRQPAVCDRSLALPKTGSNSAARMAMMAMTTSSSTSVNARIRCFPSNFIGFVLPYGCRESAVERLRRCWSAARHFFAERAEMAQPTSSQGGFDTRLLVIFLGSLAPIKADPAIGIHL